MDTPHERVSFLESFPPDIWAYFVCYLPGEQLGRLMMTGAKQLWQRLKSPKVVTSIKLGQDYIVFKSLPKFLNDFPSLEELLILSSGDKWSNELGLTLASIPSGVRKLQLSGCWSKHSKKMLGDDGTLNFSKHLPHLETLQIVGFKTPSSSWMNTHTPPSLTKLALRRWYGTEALPSSLIHFEVGCVVLSASSFVSKLPQSLETFFVSAELHGVDLLVPLLPPSSRIVHLGLRVEYSDDPRASQKLLELLPKLPNLIAFTIPYHTEIEFDRNPESSCLLPPTLTELDLFTGFPTSTWSRLPQQLTDLSMGELLSLDTVVPNNQSQQPEVMAIPFDALPRTLKSLRFLDSFGNYFCSTPPKSNRSYFPPQLTSLKIFSIQLSAETTKLLPSTLTYLDIGYLCEKICECLPTSLKTLASSGTLLSPNLIKFLPQSLTDLQLSLFTEASHWFDSNTGERVDFSSKLPGPSIHKMCASNSFDWKDSPSLPPTLTHLKFINAAELGDSFLGRQQLPNLLELSMQESQHLSDLSITVLPPHLTTLEIPSARNVSGKSFEFLPRGLTFLSLNNSENIFDSEVQHLPRTLKIAHLHRAIHLTELCLPDLPPHLHMLHLRHNSQIRSSSFPLLPYALRSSQRVLSGEFSSWLINLGVVREKFSIHVKRAYE